MPFQDVQQGLIMALSDETFGVDGIFANAAGLKASMNGEGVRLLGEVGVPISIPADVQNVSLQMSQIQFTRADADMESNGTINYADYTLLIQAFGTSLGQNGFDPRGDLDGDLTIDLNDLASAQLIPCIADVDNNGVVDQDDVDAWVALYDAGDPAAETDGSPGLTISDVLTYLNMVSTGCD